MGHAYQYAALWYGRTSYFRWFETPECGVSLVWITRSWFLSGLRQRNSAPRSP
ncbi:hypothetical protein [Alloactinosynnema sp. L-07]|nr:hypothetical protein [Alloactinosynnema sp. L-07]